MSWTVDTTTRALVCFRTICPATFILHSGSNLRGRMLENSSNQEVTVMRWHYFRCTRFQTTLDRSRLTTEGKTNKSVTMENSLDRMSGARALGWWWLTKAGETEEVEL